MNYLSLFSGAGGFEWFGKLMGWRCVGYVERDEYCQQVLRARIRDGIFDDAPIFSDVRTFDGLPYRGRVDCITAGFPCQPHSQAGKRLGDKDERNLWPDTIRIVREVRPGFVFLENVSELFRSPYIWTVIGDFTACGYNCRWEPLSAFEVGAEHERSRGWIMANTMRKRSVHFPIQPEDASAHDAKSIHASREARNAAWGSDYVSLQRLAYTGDIRAFDGLAGWGDRLKALGNGIVPAVAREAWNRLSGDTK